MVKLDDPVRDLQEVVADFDRIAESARRRGNWTSASLFGGWATRMTDDLNRIEELLGR